MTTKKLYNTLEAAEFLDLAKTTLDIWRGLGKGPKYRKIGRYVRYTEDDLQSYLDSCTRSNTSQTANA